MATAIPYDFIAVGIGPFNLGLACLAQPLGVNALFLDRKTRFSWHPGMLLDGTTLQNPFLADLVSMADPTSRFSYLNYCKQKGRLYQYYIRENWYLSRQEFDRYCQWAAGELDNLRFQHKVQDIWYDAAMPGYVLAGMRGDTGQAFEYRCRKLVIGIGSTPYCPAGQMVKGPVALHSSQYLQQREQLLHSRSITVVGSGQSGAEIFMDLLEQAAAYNYSLNWVTRSPRFFQMENAKLTLELITPDYGRYFFGLNESAKQALIADQVSIYNGINQSLIERIYHALDERAQQGLGGVRLLPGMVLEQYLYDAGDQRWHMEFCHTQTAEHFVHSCDVLVFATGYRYQMPGFIEGIRSRIRFDAQGRYAPSVNWAVDHDGREIFVQNVGFNSHGLTNPDLGLACWRNGRLLSALLEREVYPCEARTAFQDFISRDEQVFVPLRQGSARG